MKNGDFELGGYLIGRDQPVMVTKFTPGNAADRTQDTEHPTGDLMMFGRDQVTPPIWSFDLSIAQPAGRPADVGVLESLEAVMRAWRATGDRRNPGTVVPLRYMVGGRVRRVYGRPRGFQFDPSQNIEDGNITGTAQFALQDTYTYDDAVNEQYLQLRPPPNGWVTLPAVWPLISTITSTRQGTFLVESSAAAYPEDITFYGPVVNPVLENSNWRIQLDYSIPYDGWVRLDPRMATVRNQDGGDVGGALSRTTYLEDLVLEPGAQDLQFSGVDNTGTSRAVIRWRSAFYAL